MINIPAAAPACDMIVSYIGASHSPNWDQMVNRCRQTDQQTSVVYRAPFVAKKDRQTYDIRIIE